MEPKTIGEQLHWAYANLAMAHAAISVNVDKYGPRQYSVRSKLYSGLNQKTMQIGPLVEDERLKMVLPQACCYCGSRDHLSADHLISTRRGGPNKGDNLVWACRACNSSKGARDVLEWLASRGERAPVLLLRRYIKLAIQIATERELMDTLLSEAPELPFELAAIPAWHPDPNRLRLWIVDLPSDRKAHSSLDPMP